MDRHFGIPDRSVAPSLEALDAAVFDLRRRVLNGDWLYLHCWGGRGRTGLVAACLLGALYKELVDAEEALDRVQTYYNLREEGLSPETEEQKEQVRDWFRWIKGGAVRVARKRDVCDGSRGPE
jgi:protein-tyrosine phosphatase